MNKELKALERLMRLTSPAQVAVWLGLKDPRPIYQWIIRKKIPRAQTDRVKQLFIEIKKQEIPNGSRPKGKFISGNKRKEEGPI